MRHGRARQRLRDTGGVAKRNLLRIVRNPRLLVISAIQPAMLLVLFRYVLGGAIHIPGDSYVDYIVPAVFIEAVMIGGMATAIGLARRPAQRHHRPLPQPADGPLGRARGRTLADLSRSVFSLALMVGLGLLVGFSFHAGIGAIVAGLALVIFFGYCFSWIYATIGLRHQGPGNRAGRRHPAVLRARVRELGDRARRDDARAGCSRSPAISR